MGLVKYYDENLFNKKKRALARYFRKDYKYLMFEIIPKLKCSGKNDGLYQVEFPVDELFKKVYGPMILKFQVKNDVAIIEDITPEKILIACYMKDLPTHNGIPYDNEIDLKKIKMMEAILCQSGKSR